MQLPGLDMVALDGGWNRGLTPTNGQLRPPQGRAARHRVTHRPPAERGGREAALKRVPPRWVNLPPQVNSPTFTPEGKCVASLYHLPIFSRPFPLWTDLVGDGAVQTLWVRGQSGLSQRPCSHLVHTATVAGSCVFRHFPRFTSAHLPHPTLN
eukprot:59596-Pyramimonas_sp.AAC.1